LPAVADDRCSSRDTPLFVSITRSLRQITPSF
jgi:hypothetical protein